MVPNGCVTSSVVSRVTSKKETNKSASHLGHKMSKKCQTCVWTVPFRKKRKKTTNQHARIPHIGKSGTRYCTLFLCNKLISYVAFYVGPIQTGFLMTFQKSYGGTGIVIPVKKMPQERKTQESGGFLHEYAT